MLGRIFLTIDAVVMTVGSLVADYFSVTHIYNPNWPPHANEITLKLTDKHDDSRFHNAQTIFLAMILSAITLFYTWREAPTPRLRSEFLTMAALAGSIYWIAGLLAILPPETMGVDPEFGGPAFPQGKLFLGCAVLAVVAPWLES
ncbi:hypothetical protein GGS21DRAFT_487110 [Xylaria nigripes]|nr:hypothetical protein GGS21DRAFT_487110 [Xylaria nigripes]